jgi:hypothetical protein
MASGIRVTVTYGKDVSLTDWGYLVTRSQEMRMLASEWGISLRQVYRRLSGECLARRLGPDALIDADLFLEAYDLYESSEIEAKQAALMIGRSVQSWHRYARAQRNGLLFSG